MDVFSFVLCSFSVISLFISVFFFLICIIFEHCPKKVGKAYASLKQTKHKKNVPVYTKISPSSPITVDTIIENWSKGTYEYKVNNKTYKIHYVNFVPKNQMPFGVQVIYLKRIPKIAYIKTAINHFAMYSIAALIFAIMFGLYGILSLF